MNWEKKLRNALTLPDLDRLGLYLAAIGHKWKPEERTAYERRLRELRKRK